MTTVTPQDRRTKKRDWDDFFRFGQLMLGQRWVFAKTMPENPHHYTLRKHWEIDEEFAWAVAYLRANGYMAIFRKTRYIQINVNRKPSTTAEYKRMWEKHVLSAFGNKKVSAVTLADVRALSAPSRFPAPRHPGS